MGAICKNWEKVDIILILIIGAFRGFLVMEYFGKLRADVDKALFFIYIWLDFIRKKSISLVITAEIVRRI